MIQFIRKITPKFVLNWYHMLTPFLGSVFYGFPSKKIKVIGVTGTNGKTTTVNMISKILEEAGYKTAFLSSIKFQINGKERPNLLKMTMPGRAVIQKFLKEAVKEKCDYVVLEVSSEGIKQFRHLFIEFDTAVITNLSPEHIEAHNGFENYKKAKGILFSVTKKNHVINTDDDNFEYFSNFTSERKICYGTKEIKSKCKEFIQAVDVITTRDGVSFKVNNVVFNLNLLGSFNVYNALAAISVGLSHKIDLETSSKALKKIDIIPGRMEQVIFEPFKVIVDYAVTPDALEKLYKTLRNTFNPEKMIAVLGSCGGGRDKWKRPLLGEIANKYSDIIIVTNEDPYDENPMDIINSVASGVKEKAIKILDRRDAIKKALSLANKNDLIVITGKGCEPWICVANGKKIAWDDRGVIREEFEKLINIK
jgi:UDP-N-acetylmuramoyl-L-alanyl-D-glutamate--2,6-diaminopimelate ligase